MARPEYTGYAATHPLMLQYQQLIPDPSEFNRPWMFLRSGDATGRVQAAGSW